MDKNMQTNFRDCSLDYLFYKSISYILWHVGKKYIFAKNCEKYEKGEAPRIKSYKLTIFTHFTLCPGTI